jgi:hypothetical protein
MKELILNENSSPLTIWSKHFEILGSKSSFVRYLSLIEQIYVSSPHVILKIFKARIDLLRRISTRLSTIEIILFPE